MGTLPRPGSRRNQKGAGSGPPIDKKWLKVFMPNPIGKDFVPPERHPALLRSVRIIIQQHPMVLSYQYPLYGTVRACIFPYHMTIALTRDEV